MRKIVDSGLVIRAGVVLANLCLMAGLTEVFTAPGTAQGKVNLVVFTVFDMVAILGLALIIQKTLERFESWLSRTNRVARALPDQASPAYARSRHPSNGRLGVAGRESGMEPIPIDWKTPLPTDR